MSNFTHTRAWAIGQFVLDILSVIAALAVFIFFFIPFLITSIETNGWWLGILAVISMWILVSSPFWLLEWSADAILSYQKMRGRLLKDKLIHAAAGKPRESETARESGGAVGSISAEVAPARKGWKGRPGPKSLEEARRKIDKEYRAPSENDRVIDEYLDDPESRK